MEIKSVKWYRDRGVVLIVLLFGICIGCGRQNKIRDQLNLAESVMVESADSALRILDSVPLKNLRSKKDKARYAILKSMALDKNYIDTTTFEILQPAIDYYLENGTPDEKLKTFYYQGRIFQNQGDGKSALMSFMKGNALREEIHDSIILAQLLVGLGVEYYDQYKIEKYVGCNAEAGKIFLKFGRKEAARRCFGRALRGSIYLHDKVMADKYRQICDSIIPDSKVAQEELRIYYLVYGREFGYSFQEQADFLNLLDSFESQYSNTNQMLLAAQIYAQYGYFDKAYKMLNRVEEIGPDIDSIQYFYTKSFIYYEDKRYKDAYKEVCKHRDAVEDFYQELMYDGILFTEEKYNLELANAEELQKKDRIIGITIISIILLTVLLVWAYTRLKLQRAMRKNAHLEYEQQILVAENLELQVRELKEEKDNLERLISNNGSQPNEVRLAINNRIQFLNSIFVKYLYHVDTVERDNKWYTNLMKNKEEFMNTTRLAFKFSHPHFISRLEQMGLSENEINYVCLYAIGLNGKEIGYYFQLKRHYHLSSQIRKKLGLDEHQTNLGNFIRNLVNEEK